ncbi:MAG: phasin family protein [Porticoccaceae bacterium]
MQAELISSFSDYSKTAVISAKELLEINKRLMGKMLDSQISLAALYVESSEKQLGLMESIDKPAEFLSKESSLIEEYSNRFADVAQKRMQIVKETSEEFKSWVEKGMKVADEAVKEVQSNAVTAVEAKPAQAPVTKKPAVKSGADQKIGFCS